MSISSAIDARRKSLSLTLRDAPTAALPLAGLSMLPALLAAAQSAAEPGPSGVTTVGIFGPTRYVRTTGAPNVYTTTVDVPAWVKSPYILQIQNGEPNGP